MLDGVPIVTARGVDRAFGAARGARHVLAGADLDVDAGEMVAVLGRSGSGKSTLLHVLAGLDRPDAGTIDVGGVRVDRLREPALTRFRLTGVGLVFQFFHLLPELTGEENVLAPARIRGAAPGATDRGYDLIARLGLGDVADSLPHLLSGGEQQRFAIARALVNDPPLVLADEPTGNLDAASGATVMHLLRGLADAGKAVVLVTHEPEAARRADRVLELADGRLR
jgi:ABC-type lipoprotein export system ATPase subunit